MDVILSDFLQRTNADPALAQDLLEATEWDLDAAVQAYEGLKDTQAVTPQEYTYNPSDFDFQLPDIPELVNEPDCSAEEREETVEQAKQEQRRQRGKRARGLSFLAEDVIERFAKAAVSKQRVSAEEQVTINEQFFRHSFVYPDFSSETDELQHFIAKDLIEATHKKTLERSGRLNWWAATGKLPPLEPLATSGDGNCLLHAASLYMWGFHDHELILRTALHRLLTRGIEKEGIRRRWKYQTQLRNMEAGGLTFSPAEWDFEWSDVIRIATNRPRQHPTTASLHRYSSLRVRYESLEEIHIFALAYVLRRPVIVISDKVLKDMTGEDLAPIYFGGIYLPLDINPTACYKSPVVLAYDASHFSPLVAKQEPQPLPPSQKQKGSKFARMSGKRDVVIPLVTPEGELLPVQFVFDPENKNVNEKWAQMEYNCGEFPDDIVQLLESYLNVRWISLNVPSLPAENVQQNSDADDYDHLLPLEVPKVRFPAACIKLDAQPIYQKELVDKYLSNVRERFEEDKKQRQQAVDERAKWEEDVKRRKSVPCQGDGCDMFGTPATNNLCSFCYQKLEVVGKGTKDKPLEEAETQQPVESFPDKSDTVTSQLDSCADPPLVQEAIDSTDQLPTSTEVVKPRVVSSENDKKQSDSEQNDEQRHNSPSRKNKPFSSTSGTITGLLKKIQNIPQNVSRPGKSKNASTAGGYRRDKIQPIGFDSTPSADGTIQKTKCVNTECEFFGSKEMNGYCSKCFKMYGVV